MYRITWPLAVFFLIQNILRTVLLQNPDDRRDDMQKLVSASTMSYYERQAWTVDLGPDFEGQSGIAVKGWLIPRNDGKLLDRTPSQCLPVAVKMLREAHPDNRSIAGFLAETSILTKVGRHVNIVNLEGVVLQGRLKIVMEYCEIGALDGFLRKLKGATTSESKEVVRLVNGYVAFEKNQDNQLVATPDVTELICIAHQISRGMAFLSEKNIIHRDLAARNIVLTVDRIVKICDFGMARGAATVPLPVCWMAPESMVPGHGVFSTQSDVWSFGVVLWEIFTLGDVPYTTEFSHGIFYDVLYGFLRSGGRLRIPSLCPESVAVMMLECWDFTAENRPTFELLHQKLEQLLPVALRNRYVIFDADNNKINETLEITATEIDMDGNIAELVSDD
ncbi:fibroblast growth factor receptor 4-like [Paramacrobiotus metropolitanus]|uniref:fibroblast growth factor receptor 4-like n=1 Tax=Paramacrobiotus metropolitanus TaxID=2943436 RepID=UPI002445C2B4|nr:fibroblast growth factor receptor 4-like [Paramacrobiotus metropolitanus]